MIVGIRFAGSSMVYFSKRINGVNVFRW